MNGKATIRGLCLHALIPDPATEFVHKSTVQVALNWVSSKVKLRLANDTLVVSVVSTESIKMYPSAGPQASSDQPPTRNFRTILLKVDALAGLLRGPILSSTLFLLLLPKKPRLFNFSRIFLVERQTTRLRHHSIDNKI